jgi:hypothetical protein
MAGRGLSVTALGIMALLLAGCATRNAVEEYGYQRQHAIYPVAHYPHSTTQGGVRVVAIPYADGRDLYGDPKAPAVKSVPAEKTGEQNGNGVRRGLNVLETGVWPVRLLIENTGGSDIVLAPEQIMGAAGELRYPAIAPNAAINRVLISRAFREAIKGSHVGPFLKSILGGEVIVGAVQGGVSSIASGSVTGAPGGAAKGAAGIALERATGYEKSLRQVITREYTDQALRRQTLHPGFMTDGLVFVPSDRQVTAVLIPLYDVTNKKPLLVRVELR